MKYLFLNCVVVFSLFFSFTACDKPTITFSGEMKTFVESEFGKDYDGYFFREHPIGGFGSGSLYLDTEGNSNIHNNGLNLTHPDNWFRQDFSGPYPVDIFTQEEKNSINSYLISRADMGGKNWDYSSSRKITLGLEAAIPIQSVLCVKPGVQLNFEKGVTISMRIENAVMHEFSLLPFIKYGIGDTSKINHETGLPYPGPLWYTPVDLELLANAGFIVAAQDVAFEGYEAIVKIDKSVNTELYAAFEDFLSSFADPLTPNSATTITNEEIKFGFTVSRTETGSYSIKATKPVIVAVNYFRVNNGDTVSVYMNKLLEQHGYDVHPDDINMDPIVHKNNFNVLFSNEAVVKEKVSDRNMQALEVISEIVDISDLSKKLQQLLDY